MLSLYEHIHHPFISPGTKETAKMVTVIVIALGFLLLATGLLRIVIYSVFLFFNRSQCEVFWQPSNHATFY